MTVRFGVLGTVEAWQDDSLLALGHTRQRLVLGALLLDADKVVATDTLVERVWGDRVPLRGRETLYGYMSRLRRALAGTETAPMREPGGYRMAVDGGAVDALRFRSLAGQARAASGADEAALLWEKAAGLWRGPAFAGADTPWFNTQRAQLEAELLSARIDLVEARLASGRHERVLTECAARAAERPLDEQVAGQFMRALYRCGRQAEALEHYARMRRRLAEELGIDPSPALRQLHHHMLTEHPELDPPAGAGTTTMASTAALTGPTGPAPTPAPVPVPGNPVDATSAAAVSDNPVAVGAVPDNPVGVIPDPTPVPAPRGPEARPVPRQLPAPPGAFVGRAHQLDALDGMLKSRDGVVNVLPVSVIGGAGGVGKTWLALRWAHERLERFPDGQLYVDLRGFDPSRSPLPASTAVRGFLDALGTDPASVPADAEAQAALYRSLLADRSMLIVLDNARHADQIRPLLPGSATCVVLVTSRNRLDGLAATHGTRWLGLDTLPDDEAREVLTRALGEDPVAAELPAVATLLRRCAGLPLALGIVAARAAARPGFPLAALAAELDDAATRLDALNTGDLSADLRAVFKTSHSALDDRSALLFALLGLTPGPDTGLEAAARLVDLPVPRTRALLRSLEAAHLVRQHTPDRYRMHDLIRLYAAEQGHALPTSAQNAALRRLTDFYLQAAHHADRLLSPLRTPIPVSGPVRDGGPSPERRPDSSPESRPESRPDSSLGSGEDRLPFQDATAALSWFDAEYACLLGVHHLALVRGWDSQAWQLAWALDTFQWRRGRLPDRVAVLDASLAATERLGDPGSLALAHRLLGRVHVSRGQHGKALGHLRRSLALYVAAGEVAGQAQAHLNLALAWEEQGDDEAALVHATENLRLRATLDSPPREAEALNAVGWYHARLGNHRPARDHCEKALALCRAHDFQEGAAFTLDSLGYLAHHSGQHAQALGFYHQALAKWREWGDHYQEADALNCLGKVYEALGRYAEAHGAWHQALNLYRDQNRTAAVERVTRHLRAGARSEARGGG
ncbi:tetratricopeptide repeat protein [Streptomyces sp. NBC_01186]|uniref:AfsR/SARP family transcriptional regulator n=1 Tax=Streptomyces sp. NBC_01186 TaxID=2903765 RepID=UPI002E1163FB|nr:tetratricopeptide repeat protein [Streptomyces sp. NBC_01186]